MNSIRKKSPNPNPKIERSADGGAYLVFPHRRHYRHRAGGCDAGRCCHAQQGAEPPLAVAASHCVVACALGLRALSLDRSTAARSLFGEGARRRGDRRRRRHPWSPRAAGCCCCFSDATQWRKGRSSRPAQARRRHPSSATTVTEAIASTEKERRG
jgi:hypothetical protein